LYVDRRKRRSAGATASALSACSGLHARTHVKVPVDQVHFDRSCRPHQVLVDQELVTFDIIHVVVVFWLVQSQCQSRTASAGSQVDPYRRDLLLLREMLVKLLLCTVCQFKHHSLLMMKDVLSNHQEYVCQRLQTRPQKEEGVSNRLFHKKIRCQGRDANHCSFCAVLLGSVCNHPLPTGDNHRGRRP
jgi:hypothetical protein